MNHQAVLGTVIRRLSLRTVMARGDYLTGKAHRGRFSRRNVARMSNRKKVQALSHVILGLDLEGRG
jgi:hypothetical protein